MSLSDTAISGQSVLRERTLAAIGRLPVETGPLLQLIQLDSGDVDGLIRCLSHSATLSSRVLALANAAAFGAAYPLTTIKRAVLHLGVKRARSAAMCQALRMFNRGACISQDMVDQASISSVAKANAASSMAECAGATLPDEAYTQALVQDIGLLMLLMIDPDFYIRQADDIGTPLSWLEAESRHFGIDHAELGALVLEKYGVGRELVMSVRHHHEPPTDLEDELAHGRLPVFVASLFPHLDHEPWTNQMDWLNAIYRHWLDHKYDSPASFMNAAYAKARQYLGEVHHDFDYTEMVARLTESVTTDVLTMIVEDRRLEAEVEQKAALFSSMRMDALTDPLTRLLNRRGFERLAQRRIEQAMERKLSVGLMMFDLDGFKPINDAYGHDAGDLVLRGVAKLLRRHISGRDLLARVGGDEFVGLMVGLTRPDARAMAERIARSAQGVKCRIQPDLIVPIGMSVGFVYVAEARGVNAQLEQLLQKADELMYQQKRSGKRGLIWHEPSLNNHDSGETIITAL